MTRRLFKTHGFSLIEAAIVLGIVGLVIGGLWVAAAAIHNKMKIENFLILHSRGLEAARTFRRSLPDSYTPVDISRLLPARGIPSTFHLENDGANDWLVGYGLAIKYDIYNIAGNTTMWTNLHFYLSVFDPGPTLNPPLCVEMVKAFLGLRKGSGPSYELRLVSNSTGGGYTLGPLLATDPLPNTNTIVNACATTDYILLKVDF